MLARRAPRHRPAAGCSPIRRRQCRCCAHRAIAPLRTCGRAARRPRRAENSPRCRQPPTARARTRIVRRRGLDRPRVRSPPVRSRTSRSTAVFSPLKLKSIRRAMSAGRIPSAVACGALRSACVRRVAGNSTARSLPSRATRSMAGPARISEPQQLCDLVVRLPRRIVAGTADQLITSWPVDEIQAGVPAGHDQHRRRERQLAMRKRERLDVPGQVVNRDHRNAARPGERLGERDADQQRSDQARPLRHGDRVDVVTVAPPVQAQPRMTPQMSRTCCREASSGTTPPHSRWIAACEATTFERICQGRAASPVSATTAAAVSSHDVSIAEQVHRHVGERRPFERLAQRLRVRSSEDAASR